jgi:transcriptional regulator with XRE-family HTH domain
MDILIKKIRSFLDMSQVDLAEKLNVTFATVNRWENGRSVPNKLAQSKLLEICKDNAVPVYNIILEKIAECSSKLNLEDKRVILYHGSKSGINGEIAPKSRKQCDFGKGFYMGTEPSQALTLICDYDESKFYIVSVNMDDLKTLEVSANIDWAMLVAYNRGRMDAVKGTDFYNKYRDMSSNKDLIIGNIANDRMFFVIDNFFIGNITDVALVNSLSALQLGKQYVAVSQKACDAVSIEKELTLSYLERQVIKEVAEDNRAKGVSFANEICKKARREGLFFDEILDNAKEVDEG